MGLMGDRNEGLKRVIVAVVVFVVDRGVHFHGIDGFLIYTNPCFASKPRVSLKALQRRFAAFMLRPSIPRGMLYSSSMLEGPVQLFDFPGMSMVRSVCTHAVGWWKVVYNSAKNCGLESEPQAKDQCRGTAASAAWGDFGHAQCWMRH